MFKEKLRRAWLVISGKFKEYANLCLKDFNQEVGENNAVKVVSEHEHYHFKDLNVLALFLTRFQCLYTYRKIKVVPTGYELLLYTSADDYFTRIGKVLYIKFINKFRTQCNAILRDLFLALEKEPVIEIHQDFYQIGKGHFIHKLTGPRDHYLVVNDKASEVFNPHQSPVVRFLANLAHERAKETEAEQNTNGDVVLVPTEEHSVVIEDNPQQ